MTKKCLKGLGIAIGMLIVAVPALTCRLECLLWDRDPFFLFWGQFFALLPGLPGTYLRKCFYFLTLRHCSLNCEIGFMTHIHDRRTQLGERTYIGTCAGIGWVNVGDGSLLASRVSVLSGSDQHRVGSDGRLTPFDRTQAKQVQIGADTWIGEGAIIMADVASRCIVGAGSIVLKPVAAGSLVAGNPARLIRQLNGGEGPVHEAGDPHPSP
jgi:carbonic anhydrase/acetyltransferase-like protein (isoleucine patch superfamily)